MFMYMRIYYSTCTCTKTVKSDYKDDGTNVLLDANENAYGPALALQGSGRKGMNGHCSDMEGGIDIRGLNRYPDPLV